MDSDDKMVLHQFFKVGVSVDSDEEEQFTILACLLQVLADELKSAAPKHGHSKFGRKKSKTR
jgi:hypothetical protein